MEAVSRTSDMGENMVTVRDAYKSYGKQRYILRGFNMTVPKGTIYAFLGPSGCGKTTLLGCLVGRRRMDRGNITLGIHYKHQIGYMPQEPALIREMTISETLHYYSLMFSMTAEQLRQRKKELYDFLDLPPDGSIIENLSGGQQRRVSLCLTLLHDPEFLILDEPTVGLDPLLCHRIWEFLTELIRGGKRTVIITTHYIEEARQAQRVGMMREGVLLIEDNPKDVLEKSGCSSLEEVFLKLSQKQETEEPERERPSVSFKDFIAPSGTKSPIKRKQFFSTAHVYAHIIKNIYWLVRNQVLLAFILTLPVTQTLLFGLCIGRDPQSLRMGVVDEELGRTRALDCAGAFTNFSCLQPERASCRFLDHLERKDVVIVEYGDTESAREATLKGHVWGYFQVRANYTASLFERLEHNMATPDDILQESEVAVWIDMTNQYLGNFLKRDMYFAYADFLAELYEDCDWPVKASWIPIRLEPAVYGSTYPNFADFAVPSVLVLFEFYLPLLLTVGSLLMEKREGLLERNYITGLTMLESLVGHSILAMSVLVIQTLTMMFIIFIVFQNPLEGSAVIIFFLSMLVGFCGMCFGFLISIICDSDMTATYMGLGSFFPLVMLSGMIWPQEGMHFLLRIIGTILPLTITTNAFRSVASRGFGLSHPNVYMGFIILIIWVFIFAIGTHVMVKLKNMYKRLTT